MANLHDLLKYMIEKGASDLHITTGLPPSIRVDGKMKPIPGLEALTATQTKDLCYSILTDAQKHKFEENNELDLSFGVKNLSRFRANIFVQRGPWLLPSVRFRSRSGRFRNSACRHRV